MSNLRLVNIKTLQVGDHASWTEYDPVWFRIMSIAEDRDDPSCGIELLRLYDGKKYPTGSWTLQLESVWTDSVPKPDPKPVTKKEAKDAIKRLKELTS